MAERRAREAEEPAEEVRKAGEPVPLRIAVPSIPAPPPQGPWRSYKETVANLASRVCMTCDHHPGPLGGREVLIDDRLVDLARDRGVEEGPSLRRCTEGCA